VGGVELYFFGHNKTLRNQELHRIHLDAELVA
jgi:hypothetical protein